MKGAYIQDAGDIKGEPGILIRFDGTEKQKQDNCRKLVQILGKLLEGINVAQLQEQK